MRHRVLGFVAVLATLLAGVGLVAPVGSAAAATLPDGASAEWQFLALLNNARLTHGRPPLVRDGRLDGVARAWSAHMGAVYLVTGDPVVKVSAPTNCQISSLCHRPDLVAQVGAIEPSWRMMGENIGVGSSVTLLNQSFMRSPGHLANILGAYNRVGVGVLVQGPRLWVTVDFLSGPAIGGTTGTEGAMAINPPPAGLVPPVVTLSSRDRYNAVSPVRVLDTRSGLGGYRGRLAAGGTLRLRLFGVGGVPSSAGGVAMNLAAIQPLGGGFITAFPCGQARPLASSLNVRPGETRANHSVTALDATGSVCIYTSITTYLLADLAGWYGATGYSFRPSSPVRVLDSRRMGARTSFVVPLAGRVSRDAGAATVNLTVVGPGGNGYVTAYPCGQAAPVASNVNFFAGETIANLATVRLGAGQSICVRSSVATYLVVDLSGAYGASGGSLSASVPDRFMDTRNAAGGWIGALAAKQRVTLAVGGANGLPNTATTAVLNVTITGAAAPGWLVAYPCDIPMPTASNLNFRTGDTVPNQVVVRLDASGRVCVSASARVYVVVDVSGWFSA